MHETPTDEAALIDRLAERYGIQPQYYDIWGGLHRVSIESKRALLGAMGLPVEDVGALSGLLDAERAKRWQRVLQPAYVLKHQAGLTRLSLCFPRTVANSSFRWTLRLEEGQKHEGLFRPRDLQLLEEEEHGGRRWIACRLDLPVPLPLGYHSLRVAPARGQRQPKGSTTLIVTPERCYQPPAVSNGARVWGPAVQLYGLRSERQWGIGDFTDLRKLVELASRLGAAIVGLNPLHSLFQHNPLHVSPYSPSSRLFVNPWYIDVESVPELDECEEARRTVSSPVFQRRLRDVQEGETVDYLRVAALKRPVLEQLYQHFCSAHVAPQTSRAKAFAAFVSAGGDALYRHALYEALQEHLYRQMGMIGGWTYWPEGLRDPHSADVAAFAEAQADRVRFFQYLQWLADEQLGWVGGTAYHHGLGVGLYADLAVSTDRGGAETWASRDVFALGASVGAPPDDFSPRGQDWGLPPMIPEVLAEQAYRPFVAVLRANMKHAGALRIDHVMGLMRLFWVPPGRSAADGAYVTYPFEEMLAILALESERNNCLVIGEDLGTVPDEVRHAMDRMGILSYRPMFFQRGDGGAFLPPEVYPRQALVAVSTHDLPTLEGYWEGRDIRLREELGIFASPEQVRQQLDARNGDRWQLLQALQRHGLLPHGVSTEPVDVPQLTPELLAAVHVYLARTASQVMMVQWEDVLGLIEQANVPGTTDEHPNWKRRIPVPLEHLGPHPVVRSVAEALAREQRGSWPQI